MYICCKPINFRGLISYIDFFPYEYPLSKHKNERIFTFYINIRLFQNSVYRTVHMWMECDAGLNTRRRAICRSMRWCFATSRRLVVCIVMQSYTFTILYLYMMVSYISGKKGIKMTANFITTSRIIFRPYFCKLCGQRIYSFVANVNLLRRERKTYL